MHAAASAFVTGADYPVIAGAIATAVGVLIALVTLRAPRRAAAQASAAVEVPVRAEVPVAAGAAAR
jgi:hypothetical protein